MPETAGSDEDVRTALAEAALEETADAHVVADEFDGKDDEHNGDVRDADDGGGTDDVDVHEDRATRDTRKTSIWMLTAAADEGDVDAGENVGRASQTRGY